MNYEFQSQLFDTARDMLNAVAYEWMTAGGNNTPEMIDTYPSTPEADARECINGWGLDDEASDGDSWMSRRDVSESDVVEAFKRFYATRPDRKA